MQMERLSVCVENSAENGTVENDDVLQRFERVRQICFKTRKMKWKDVGGDKKLVCKHKVTQETCYVKD